jgi:hypothetical protein
MIGEIEKASSGRSSCTKCKKGIKIGSLRGIEHGVSFGHPVKAYYCLECTKTILSSQIAYFHNLQLELEK